MKLNLKDLEKYLFPLKRIFSKYRQIRSVEHIRTFIQEQSAQVSQMTLYGYLKTRMGAKYVLMFEDEIFLGSINKAKWHIYAAALQDLTFYTISYLKNERNLHDTEKSKTEFSERYEKIKWTDYYKSLPFNSSALALYNWSPIAEELKTLDKKIVLNSMILKWDNIKKEFIDIINI